MGVAVCLHAARGDHHVTVRSGEQSGRSTAGHAELGLVKYTNMPGHGRQEGAHAVLCDCMPGGHAGGLHRQAASARRGWVRDGQWMAWLTMQLYRIIHVQQ